CAGARALPGRLGGGRPGGVTLGYHRGGGDLGAGAAGSIPAMLPSRRMFEQQLDWIGRRFKFVDLDEMGRRFADGGPADTRLAAVTFDDGYRDTYEEAFPILKRKGIPSAVFVVTDLVGTDQLLVHDALYLLMCRAFRRWVDAPRTLRSILIGLDIRLAAMDWPEEVVATPLAAAALLLRTLPRRAVERIAHVVEARVGAQPPTPGMRPLTWEMTAGLQRQGVVIGSHTRTHAWLTREDPHAAFDEVLGSRREIERRLGVPVRHFCYPDGRFDRAITAAVADAGYRFGYTTCTHRDSAHPLLTLPRLMLWQNASLGARGHFSPAVMCCQGDGVWNRLADERHTDHAA